nr:MAG TPA: hypothetical protein [Caudoviricetes sp.]
MAVLPEVVRTAEAEILMTQPKRLIILKLP